MMSKERVLAAFNRVQTDRVPIDFGGHRSSGISAIAYARLRDYLDLPPKPVRVYDMIQQLAVIDDDVLDLFEVDTIELGRGFCLRDSDWKDWILPDGTPCQVPAYVHLEQRGLDWFLLADDGIELAVQRDGCLYFEQTCFPYLNRNPESESFDNLPDTLRHVVWASVPHPGAHLPLTDENLKIMAQRTRQLRAGTDRAIVALAGGSMFEMGHYLFRMDEYLMNLGLYGDAMHRFQEKLCEMHLATLERWLTAIGPYVDVICFGGDDLGSQTGLLISPTMYREFVKPYHQKIWRRARELTQARILLHCCGAIRPLLADFVEAGLDAVNPVQISCEGMDADSLKAEFGDALTFWGGGCDTRQVLPHGSQQEIIQHTRQQIDTMNQNGGFVFQQVHNIQANVPPDHIVAMFNAVKNYPNSRPGYSNARAGHRSISLPSSKNHKPQNKTGE